MRFKKTAIIGGLTLACGGWLLLSVSHSDSPPEIPARSVSNKAPSAYLGAVSCAASACHNAGGSTGSMGSEYSTWLLGDPHASRAFAVLSEERSNRMARIYLNKPNAVAAKEETCLKCHAMQLNVKEVHESRRSGEAIDTSLTGEGVSCEACHGPSEHWRRDHFSADWKAKDAPTKHDLGFHLTRSADGRTDLTRRVQKCAECHVGSKDKEVDHDLIAAGHPPLYFEYSAYESIYPNKHWHDRDAGHAIRAWAIGQIAVAKATIELTQTRAERVGSNNSNGQRQVWPEFSESSCFACHHDLKGTSKRQEFSLKRVGERKLGSLPWGTWNLAMLEMLAKSEGPFAAPKPDAFVTQLRSLRAVMEQPVPDPKRVGPEVANLKAMLDDWQKSAKLRPALTDVDVRKLMQMIRQCALAPGDALRQWDSATQHYLGLAACASELGEGLRPEQRAALTALRDQLKFAKGRDGPEEFDPEALRKAFEAVRP